MVASEGQLTIDIRPAVSVYATYRRLSYQPWYAIAEFVDNSTQSYYDHRAELIGGIQARRRPRQLKSRGRLRQREKRPHYRGQRARNGVGGAH